MGGQPADEHGFNNPLGFYEKGEVDIVLIGDSFAHGACVQQGQDTAGQIRQAGVPAITLGYVANGPLIELATLTEYAKHLQPKVVLWMYYESNDISDLDNENKLLTLKQYLDDNFSQHLIERQKGIDRALKAFVIEEMEQRHCEVGESHVKKRKIFTINGLIAIMKLWNLRSLLLTSPSRDIPPLFYNVLNKAKERVQAWGGQIYFVYLPD